MRTKSREALHHLVDRLPEYRLATAREVLEALGSVSPLARSLAKAPIDDEPDDDDFDGGLTEAREEAGQEIPHEEAMRQLGLT